MKSTFKLTIIGTVLACSVAHAQPMTNPAPSQSGINRMKSIIDGVSKDEMGGLAPNVQQAITTGEHSATVSADIDHMDAKTVDFSVEQSEKWQKMAREAYVAALPPRDRALGASVLLGDGTGGVGHLYIFVSRSMPASLLRAYAVDAFYTGARLVVKGVRKGDTLKEYLADAVESFNSLEGMSMAAMEINPNLFDMFDVKVVPAVVWTDRVGLDDIGSGCSNVPEGTVAQTVNFTGPEDQTITVEKPVCAKLPDTAFYKMTGALAMPYVLEKFHDAGLPKAVTDGYLAKLAERTGNVHDGSVTQTIGNAMAPVGYEAKLDRWPKAVLRSFEQQLKEGNVQRGPFGPSFSPGEEDDAAYRQELNEKIRHGLGL